MAKRAITDAIAALEKKPASIKIGDVDADGDRDTNRCFILLRKIFIWHEEFRCND